MKAISIVIGGDVCPIRLNQPLFEAGDAAGIFHDLLDCFAGADLAIVNLECPLIERRNPILKSGPVLGATGRCVNSLKNAGIAVVNLANNHALDHHAEGLMNTLRVCREAGIETVGAGGNLEQAGRPLLRTVKGARIAVLGFAEHGCSQASRTEPGANPVNLMEYVRQTRSLKGQYDCLIVLFHTGTSFYPYPSPEIQQVCRFMVEEGATAVICQHSHCPGTHERYLGGQIVYGQGNLVFETERAQVAEWNRGFLVRLSVTPGKPCDIDLVPYVQSSGQRGARRMAREDEAKFLRDIAEKSARLGDPEFVEAAWREFCLRQKYRHFSILHGHNRIVRILNRLTHFTDWFCHPGRMETLKTTVICESHAEMLRTILSERRTPSRTNPRQLGTKCTP